MTVSAADPIESASAPSTEQLVGKKLREIRVQKGYSLRNLSDRSGLNINTLSLIENGKTSPSVSTLQQLAVALGISISVFFESEPEKKRIVFTRADDRPEASFNTTRMQNLAKDLASNAVQPFVVTLLPGFGSGDRMIVHTGHEFVFCLTGAIHYRINGEDYFLAQGDSLVFESHLPHCWENQSDSPAQILLILLPADRSEELGGRHFLMEMGQEEEIMKIAVITDDEKTISQHFGRAPYYMVVTVEEGKISGHELRPKLGHNHFQGMHGEEGHEHEHEHGHDEESHQKHASMAEAISDCQIVICGGMGMGAYESMRRLNIKPVVTDMANIDEAVQAYLDGKLVDHTEKLH